MKRSKKGAFLILSERKSLILLSQNWFRFRKKWLGNYFKQENGKQTVYSRSRAKYYDHFGRKTAKILNFLAARFTNYEYLTRTYVLPEKGVLKKAATIKTLAYSLLGTWLKKKTSIEKDQYKLLRNQINVINNNIEDNKKRKEDVKIDVEIIVNIGDKYIGDELKNLTANNFWIMD